MTTSQQKVCIIREKDYSSRGLDIFDDQKYIWSFILSRLAYWNSCCEQFSTNQNETWRMRSWHEGVQ